MSLRDQKDPVVTIGEEESESKWVDGIEDDEIVRDLDYGATGHVSRDSTCTRIEVTQLSWYVDESDRP